MDTRNLNPQDIIAQKIRVLFPDAKFSVRPFDNNSHLAKNPVVVDTFLVDWDISNPSPCPTITQINAVTDKQKGDHEESERKKDRDEVHSKDLALIAAYESAKKENPNLTFSEYLDSLEDVIKKP